MKPPETIETARLCLRPPTLQDAETLFNQYAQDPEVTRYMTWSPHTNIQQTEAYLRSCLVGWEEEIRFPWIITLKKSQLLIGMVELRFEYGAAIGYVLAKQFWGQGYMPETVQSLIDWALEQDSLHRVWSVCDVENQASARVLEKVGMSREGTLRRWMRHPNISNVPRDCDIYARIK